MKKVILSLSLITAAFGVYAQNATLALKLAKGDKFKLVYATKTNAVTEFGGQEMKTDLTSATGQLIEVTDASNGNYTLAVTNEGNVGKMSMMGNDMEFNTTKGEGFDMAGGVPAFMKAAAGFTYEMVVNSKGELISTKGFDKLKKASAEEAAGLSMMGGNAISNITDSGMIKLTLLAFQYAGKGAVKVGDTWNENTAEAKNNLSYKNDITAVNGTDVVVSKAGKNKINTKNSGGPMGEMEINSEVDSKFTITISATSGITKGIKRSDSAKSIINAGGQEIPNNAVTDSDLTITKQ